MMSNRKILSAADKHTVQAFDLLRFPLIIFVVTVHVFNPGVMEVVGADATSNPIYSNLSMFITAYIQRVAVPIFFFISGYMFFLNANWSRETYLQKLKNRVHTLLVPYIAWIALAIALTLFKYLPLLDMLRPANAYLHLSVSSLLSCFWNYDGTLDAVQGAEPIDFPYPFLVPLWFMRDLMIVVLFTPVLHFLLKKFGYFVLLVLGIIFLLPIGERYGLLLQAFFFFSWGSYMSIYKKDLSKSFRPLFKYSIVAYLIIGILLLLTTAYWWRLLLPLKGIVGVFLAYGLADWLLRKNYAKTNPFLASASFFVYASHALFCDRLTKALFVLLRPDTNLGVTSVYIVSEIVLVMFLLLVYYLLRRFCPPVMKVLVGR